MLNLRQLATTFLDGFAPLDNIWGGAVRPGSDENLIDTTEYEIPESASQFVEDLHQRAAQNLRRALLEKAESLAPENEEGEPAACPNDLPPAERKQVIIMNSLQGLFGSPIGMRIGSDGKIYRGDKVVGRYFDATQTTDIKDAVKAANAEEALPYWDYLHGK